MGHLEEGVCNWKDVFCFTFVRQAVLLMNARDHCEGFQIVQRPPHYRQHSFILPSVMLASHMVSLKTMASG
jgi:hypothetical protein